MFTAQNFAIPINVNVFLKLYNLKADPRPLIFHLWKAACLIRLQLALVAPRGGSLSHSAKVSKLESFSPRQDAKALLPTIKVRSSS